MRLSLKDRLLRYLKNRNDWISSGELQRIAAENTSYTPQTVGRDLRRLREDGKIERELRRGHAFYRFKITSAPLPVYDSRV